MKMKIKMLYYYIYLIWHSDKKCLWYIIRNRKLIESLKNELLFLGIYTRYELGLPD